MAKWVCTVCGYVYEGENPPAECPVCHVGADKFKKVEGDLTLAAEHEFGVYASTVKNNPEISDEDKKYIFEQLKANFEGECSEVGMYLCMARVAHREGYPEIGLYWEKAAYEEAEHAAKFAEMLGEDLEPNMRLLQRTTSLGELTVSSVLQQERLTLLNVLRRTTLMQSMIQFMRWLVTRLDTEEPLRDFLTDILANYKSLDFTRFTRENGFNLFSLLSSANKPFLNSILSENCPFYHFSAMIFL